MGDYNLSGCSNSVKLSRCIISENDITGDYNLSGCSNSVKLSRCIISENDIILIKSSIGIKRQKQ